MFSSPRSTACADTEAQRQAHLVMHHFQSNFVFLPGTDVFDRLRSNPRLWHFAFHNAIDVAEMLVAGRERQYLQSFFYARNFDPSAILRLIALAVGPRWRDRRCSRFSL